MLRAELCLAGVFTEPPPWAGEVLKSKPNSVGVSPEPFLYHRCGHWPILSWRLGPGTINMNYRGHLAIPQPEIPFLFSPLSEVSSSTREGYLFLWMGQCKYGGGKERLGDGQMTSIVHVDGPRTKSPGQNGPMTIVLVKKRLRGNTYRVGFRLEHLPSPRRWLSEDTY